MGLLSSREEIDFFGYRTGSKQKIIILAPRGAVEDEMEMVRCPTELAAMFMS